eukprot:CAMPEP_0197845490 /NCGR_PEP_ID=MMETSP1438-20131217/2411_1 /TAXON_ID=1461541 /ORGANISM="Pterosperma sp., Strain CCMP1384" /LENGTH=404 /DNA_ID=CAMNT_0043456801 /DNA_START=127 /DNA_END=1341 /DNA_ORIENTATION=-
MQYYTKQQLQGAGKYNGPCRVGNWSEDVEASESQLKDYLYKKQTGDLKLDRLRFRTERALSEVTLTTIADDGFVHFGDMIQVISTKSGFALSMDSEDADPRPGENACAVTASVNTSPVARNTFLLVKYIPARPDVYTPEYEGETLHYGQKVMLVVNPQVNSHPVDVRGGPEPWYLRSVHTSTTHHSKFTHQQEVSVCPKYSYDNVWVVVHPELSKEKQIEGAAVPTNEPVILEHCGTKQHLQCGDNSYWNDFGEEKEVTAFSAVRNHKQQALEGCSNGVPPKLVEKNKEESNYWIFRSGSIVRRLPHAEPQKFDPKAILKKLLYQLGKLGANGFASMKKCFAEFDADGSGNLDIVEFKKCLRFCLINVSDEEAEVLLAYFDEDASGSINVDELIKGLNDVDNSA